MPQDVPRLQPAPHARGTGGTCRGETFQSFGPSGERVRRSPAVPGEQRLGLGTWTRPHLRGPARGARPERGRASARAEPSGNGQTAAREDVGRRRSREWCPTPASVGWALLAVAQSGLERLPGVPGRLPTAAPCPGGSAGTGSLARSGCVSLPPWAGAAGHSAPLPAGPCRCGSPALHSIIRAVITTIYLCRAPHARVSRVVF